jgi:hypothetical protein
MAVSPVTIQRTDRRSNRGAPSRCNLVARFAPTAAGPYPRRDSNAPQICAVARGNLRILHSRDGCTVIFSGIAIVNFDMKRAECRDSIVFSLCGGHGNSTDDVRNIAASLFSPRTRIPSQQLTTQRQLADFHVDVLAYRAQFGSIGDGPLRESVHASSSLSKHKP